MEFYVTKELLAVVPLVIGCVEAFKYVGLPPKFAPIISVIMGVIFAALVAANVPSLVLGGITVGRLASGLYSGVKATIQ